MNETKRTPAVEATISLEANTLELAFATGDSLTVRVDDLAGDIRRMAVLHGLKQKLVDAAAISRNPDTGRSATAQDKYEAVRAVYDRLVAGAWNATRGEGAGGQGGLLFRALCRMYPAKTPQALREFLAAKSPAEQAALRKNPRVAQIIDDIRAEAANGDAPDTDGMLDELNG